MVNRRPKFELVAPTASPAQAAAIVAALERFMRDTAPPPAQAEPEADPWMRAAMLERVSRLAPADEADEREPWLNT